MNATQDGSAGEYNARQMDKLLKGANLNYESHIENELCGSALEQYLAKFSGKNDTKSI